MPLCNRQHSKLGLVFLEKKKRKHVRENCIRKLDLFTVEAVTEYNDEEFNEMYELYRNVKNTSLKLNTFDLPKKLFRNFIDSKYWDVCRLRLKENNKIVSVIFNFLSDKNYCPMVIGLDYDYVKSHGVYRQMIYQSILRAKELNKTNIHLGMEAPVEKRKFGGIAFKKSAFVQFDNNFKAELISQTIAV